jgi:hypothetical protein
MTWKASLVLVTLAVACGGSSNGSGGTAGNGGGAAGTGGEGGFARVGGTGGTADPRSEYGTLVECEQVEQNFISGVYERLDYAVIPASPGEVLTITA